MSSLQSKINTGLPPKAMKQQFTNRQPKIDAHILRPLAVFGTMELLSCPLCLKPHFEGVDALRSTLISVATSQLSCPVCNETLLGLDKLTIHLFSHVTQKNVVASDVQMAQQEPEGIPPIEEVQQVIESQNEVKENGKCIYCDICNFCFNDESILEMHQKLLHQTAPDQAGNCSYHCHLCSKKFKMRGSLMVHLRVAHYGFGHNNGHGGREDDVEAGQTEIIGCSGGGESNKSVNVCGNKEKVQNSGKMQDNKQWECEVCSKMFTTKYFLKKHKRLHTGEMPYYCAQCNKSFTFQQSYHKHMLYHSSEKPHVCTECGRAFKELSTLHNHERIHSGERPFACETCGKCFRQRVSYLVHRRIHTGVMPYKCNVCDKSFRYKVSQRSHKCTGPQSPQSEGNSSDVVGTTTEAGTEIYNGANYSIKLMDSTISIPNANFQIVAPCINTESAEELVVNVNLVENDNNITTPAITPPLSYDSMNTDFYSMVLSPLLPDVQSLCLDNNVNEDTNVKNVEEEHDVLETINKESLKELLYGPSANNFI